MNRPDLNLTFKLLAGSPSGSRIKFDTIDLPTELMHLSQKEPTSAAHIQQPTRPNASEIEKLSLDLAPDQWQGAQNVCRQSREDRLDTPVGISEAGRENCALNSVTKGAAR
jgi:hypothetical protein